LNVVKGGLGRPVCRVRTLLELQSIDLEIDRLTQRLKDIPAESAALETELSAEQVARDSLHDERQRLEKQRDAEELDLESKLETLHKWETQLLQIRTNKEYQAMLTEIGSLKIDISRLEDRVLESIEAIEDAAKREEDCTRKYNEDKKRVEAEQQRLRDEDLAVREEIEKLAAAREPVIPRIDPDLLARYERVRNARKGTAAIVEVRNGACTACNRKLRPQMVNDVLVAEKIVVCQTCSCILYDPESLGVGTE